VPAVDTSGQAGLFDVVPHPDYAKNGWLYLAFSDPQEKADGSKVSLTTHRSRQIERRRLHRPGDRFSKANPSTIIKAGGVHFGGRIAFDGKGYIFFTIGERGQGIHAQNSPAPTARSTASTTTAACPPTIPSSATRKADPTIWSYGHRNPQGLAFHPVTGELFDAEHGPRGGDELNLVQKGVNYGWPVITYGMNYDGTAMTDITAKDGMAQPVTYWVPSIAPCGANFYAGDLFPKWKNNLFVASLAAEELAQDRTQRRQARRRRKWSSRTSAASAT